MDSRIDGAHPSAEDIEVIEAQTSSESVGSRMKRLIAFSDTNVSAGMSNPRYNIKLVTKEISWEELAEFLSKCQQGGKNDAYFLRGGDVEETHHISGSGKDWGVGKFRTDEGLKSAWLIVIDGDDADGEGVALYSAEKASAVMEAAGLNYVVYTTHSQAGGKNKWRLVIPTDQEFFRKEGASQEERNADLIAMNHYVCDLLDEYTGIEIDRVGEMDVWSQAWYLPLRDNPDDGLFWSKYKCDGKDLCVDEVLNNYVPKASRVNLPAGQSSAEGGGSKDSADVVGSGKTLAELNRTIITMGTGCHDAIRTLLYQYARDGMSKAQGCAIVKSLLECVPEDKRNDRWEERYNDVERTWGQVQAKDESDVATDEDFDKLLEKEAGIEPEIELDWPPGIVGDIAKSVYAFSDYPNKDVSIVTALGLFAGVIGRRFNVNGDGLNLYLTLLMETGEGKKVISAFISRFLRDAAIYADGNRFIGPKNMTSAKALLKKFNKNRCFLSVLTEAGFLFSSQAGDAASRTRAILDLYGASGANSFMEMEAYSHDEDDTSALQAPCFSMINESTPKVFMKALGGDKGTETGELTRMTILNTRLVNSIPLNRNKVYEVSDSSTAVLKSLLNFCSITQDKNDPKAIDIDVDSEHFDYIDECKNESFNLKYDDPIKSRMLSRQGFKTIKVAALISVAQYVADNIVGNTNSKLAEMQENGETIPISAEGFEWAKSLSAYELRGLKGVFSSNVYNDPISLAMEKFAKVCLKLLEVNKDDIYGQKYRIGSKAVKARIIPRAKLRTILANHSEIKDLAKYKYNDAPFDIIIEYAIRKRYITETKWGRGKGYRINAILIEDFMYLNPDKSRG